MRHISQNVEHAQSAEEDRTQNDMGLDGVDWSKIGVQDTAMERANERKEANAQLGVRPIAELPNGTKDATISVLTHRDFIGKRFSTDALGNLQKTSSATFHDGHVTVHPAGSASALALVISILNPETEALTLGRLRDGRRTAPVTTVSNLNAGRDKVARSQVYFGHPNGTPGWLLLDLDLGSLPDEVRARVDALGGPLKALAKLLPEIPTLSYVIRPSSSAGVRLKGEKAPRIQGWHAFVKIANADDTEVILRALMNRCWELGFGYFLISASGQRLERGLIDASVGGPERLIFTADPILEEGVERDAPQMHWHEGASLSEIPSYDAEKACALRNEAYEAAETAALDQYQRWAEERVVDLMATHGIDREAAESMLSDFTDDMVIADDWLIQFEHGHQRVGDLLDEIEQLHGSTGFSSRYIPDPIEGARYSTTGAGIFWNAGEGAPFLVSFAHGHNVRREFARYRATSSGPEKHSGPVENIVAADNVPALSEADANIKAVSPATVGEAFEALQSMGLADLAGRFGLHKDGVFVCPITDSLGVCQGLHVTEITEGGSLQTFSKDPNAFVRFPAQGLTIDDQRPSLYLTTAIETAVAFWRLTRATVWLCSRHQIPEVMRQARSAGYEVCVPRHVALLEEDGPDAKEGFERFLGEALQEAARIGVKCYTLRAEAS